jgi:hypothetical protein
VIVRNTHPVLMVDTWLKEAQELQRPAGMGDVRRRQSSLGRDRQDYAQPNPPAAMTRPDTITNQKTLSPPL